MLTVMLTIFFDFTLQEVQLSQRGRAMHRVIGYFAKSVKVTDRHSTSFEVTPLNWACGSPYQ